MTSETTEAAAPPTFAVLALSNELRRAVDDLGYTHPTPVQRAVFEPAIRGRDLVVQARTGTGKTAAFGMPILDVLVKRNSPTVQALVLCPTRELALQVTRELDALGKYRGTRTIAVYGGAPMPRQIEQIRAGAQVLVGTPGRVLDHLRRRTLDASMLRVLVLDESDEMLSMGFLPQITDIMSFLPESRQILLFSATLPADIRRVADTRLKSPEYLTLSGDQIGALEIGHFVYLSHGDKVAELIQILEIENPESAIIFSNTRDDTKRVAQALKEQGYAAEWLNADLAQGDREKVMAMTRKEELRFLVATDVAARGIDISHLTHVINFDFPDSAESYVHRTGRTGRAGRTGTAISLIEPGDIGNLYLLRLTYKIRPIEKQLPSARELRTRAEADLVRMFTELFASRRTHPDDLALARRLLTHEQADVVVAGLLRDHLGARPDAIEEATASRRARMPPPLEAPPEPAPKPKREGPRQERDATPERAPERSQRRPDERERERPHERERERPRREPGPKAPEPLPQQHSERSLEGVVQRRVERSLEGAAPAPDDAVAEIFVSVGRRDGAKPSDFQVILEQNGIAPDHTDYVRVRHGHAFVGVKREACDRAVSALNGATIAGRKALAELARRR